jgi:outer membrane receptor protein involved in Fe transport
MAGFWAYGAYASDSWRLNNRVTLNLGLRWDRFRIFLPGQEHPVGRFNSTLETFPAVDNVIDWNVLAPRVGVVTGLSGDGQTIL